MIEYFKVKNFYSIRNEQCLSFEPTQDMFMLDEYAVQVNETVRLLKVAILYGNNASGKTNVLHALASFRKLMLHVPENRNEEIDSQPFLLDNESRQQPTEMSLSFYIDREKYVLTITYNKTNVLSESLDYYKSKKGSNLYTRSYIRATDETQVVFGSALKLKKKSKDFLIGNTTNNCTVLAAFSKTNMEASALNKVYDYLMASPDQMLQPHTSFNKRAFEQVAQEGETKKFIINLLKASDFNISDIQVEDTAINMEHVGENKELVFTHESELGHFNLDGKYESKGTLRFLSMAVLLSELLQENRVLCIDELETSLHYELLAYFVKLFLINSTKYSQLVFTTHDTNLLNEDFIRRDAVWFTSKDNIGGTHLNRLSGMGLHKTISPYNAYRQGKLVDLPFLGSVYLDINQEEEE